MFTTESALVKLWVRYIKEGKYTRGQVPNLSNLRMCFCCIGCRISNTYDRAVKEGAGCQGQK